MRKPLTFKMPPIPCVWIVSFVFNLHKFMVCFGICALSYVFNHLESGDLSFGVLFFFFFFCFEKFSTFSSTLPSFLHLVHVGVKSLQHLVPKMCFIYHYCFLFFRLVSFYSSIFRFTNSLSSILSF